MKFYKKYTLKICAIFILVGIILISCALSSKTALKTHTAIVQIFSNEEIVSLESIITFFDKIIMEKTQLPKVNDAYCSYFETINKKESFDEFEKLIHIENKESYRNLITQLKEKGMYKKIWIDAYKYKSFVRKDTLKTYRRYKWENGKYMNFLRLVGEKDTFIKDYRESIIACGDICLTDIVSFMKFYKRFDFNKEIDRLMYAVHYLTLLSEEKYKK